MNCNCGFLHFAAITQLVTGEPIGLFVVILLGQLTFPALFFAIYTNSRLLPVGLVYRACGVSCDCVCLLFYMNACLCVGWSTTKSSTAPVAVSWWQLDVSVMALTSRTSTLWSTMMRRNHRTPICTTSVDTSTLASVICLDSSVITWPFYALN